MEKNSSKSKTKRLKSIRIDAGKLHYKLLNEQIHQAMSNGSTDIVLDNVCGQRYIGDGLKRENVHITIHGIPGNDLGAFMDGPRIEVMGNAQDGVGNTMNSGDILIHGDTGDIVGHSMRGGRVFVLGDAGYRVGIHMKAYQNMFPVVIIGGTVKDFPGEYMAGGMLVVLGMNNKNLPVAGDFIGTGMHGGSIFIRGEVDPRCLGKEVKQTEPLEEDLILLKKYLSDYCKSFKINRNVLLKKPFVKLYPYTHRPYGRLYAY